MRYLNIASTLALTAAFVLFLGSSSQADLKKLAAGGAISGKVVDSSGAPASGAKVRVLPAVAKPDKAAKPDKHARKTEAGDAKPDKPNRPALKAVAEGTTDAQGAFKLEGIPAGEYTVQVMLKEKGEAGRANVTVADGQTADVSVSLKARGEKKN